VVVFHGGVPFQSTRIGRLWYKGIVENPPWTHAERPIHAAFIAAGDFRATGVDGRADAVWRRQEECERLGRAVVYRSWKPPWAM